MERCDGRRGCWCRWVGGWEKNCGRGVDGWEKKVGGGEEMSIHISPVKPPMAHLCRSHDITLYSYF